MILIYGSTRDDVSYFETRIQNKKEETIQLIKLVRTGRHADLFDK